MAGHDRSSKSARKEEVQKKKGKREMMSSMLRKVFKSRKRKSTEVTSEDAINQLREIEELLIKKQNHFEKKIEQEVATAREAGTKNKRVALAALKRKRLYDSELARIDGVLTKLEAQRNAIENAGTNAEVMNVLGSTTKALKKANLELDINKVSDLMDTIAEQLDTANEFSAAISQPINGGVDLIQEEDLEAELEKIKESLDPSSSVAAPSISLPDAPSAPLTRAKAKLERDVSMAELEEWAAAN